MNSFFYNRLRELYKKKDFVSLAMVVKDNIHVENDSLYAEDPFTCEESVAVYAKNKQGSQIIIFKSTVSEKLWAMVQCMNFIDLIVDFNRELIFTDNAFMDQVSEARLLLKEVADSGDIQERIYGGFLLNNNRPYHFFYDGLKSVIEFERLGFGAKIATKNPFYDISKLGLNSVEIDHDKIYLKPSVIGQNYCSKNIDSALPVMNSMEELLRTRTSSNKFFNKCDYEKIFWFGITGQKRSWIDQVQAYTSIILELHKYYPDALYVIDGMTSDIHNRVDSVEETVIISQMLDIIDNADVKNNIFPMTSFNYEEKIAIAKDCDYHISNSGTGCMVPSRICKIPGVIHTNGILSAFPGFPIEAETQFIDPEQITLVGNSQQPAMYRSYSIAWQHVFNKLASVINCTESADIKTLEVPVNRNLVLDDLALSEKLLMRVEKHGLSQSQLIEVLKEISAILELKGNHKSSLDVIVYALMLRPNGKYIKNKVKKLFDQVFSK